MDNKTSAGIGTRTRFVALAIALLVGLLGLVVPTAAHAAGATASGTITFPSDMPANLKNPVDQALPYDQQTGLTLSLYLNGSSPGVNYELGRNANVTYNPSTGAWSATDLPNGTYNVYAWVRLPGGMSASPANQTTVTVSGANVTVPGIAIQRKAMLGVSVGTCGPTGFAVPSVKNVNTGTVYQLESGQSGWGQPEPRCATGQSSSAPEFEGYVNYGNYNTPSTLPIGTYILFADKGGVREYFTDQNRGSASEADAVRYDVQYWQGTRATVLYGAVGPTISGTPRVGVALTANKGVWDPDATLTYQWKRDGAAISGATALSYTPVTADVGKNLTFSATGTLVPDPLNPVTETMTSAPITVLAEFTDAPTPTISGTAQMGQTLTANAGTWSPTATLAYQWKRGGANIAGATAATYVPVTADVGQTLTVSVTGTRTGYASQTKTSAPTAAVVGVFSAAPTPTVSGTAQMGQTLTANAGTWSPTATLAYQWKRAGANIAGATGATYVPVVADVGQALTVSVTGTRSGYTSQTKTSAPTAAVKGVFSSAPAPLISGAPEAGQTLIAVPGAWAPTATFAYQWRRGGTAISGETSSSYALTSADIGKAITVSVTGTRTDYVPVTKTSAAVIVTKPSSLPTPVRLSGPDRYSTAVAVSKSSYPNPAAVDTVVLASGDGFADSLSATPLAAKLGAPMLLSGPASLSAATAAEISRLNPTKVIIIGGSGAIGKAIENQLAASYEVERYSGSDRYETSRVIATKGWNSATEAFVATGAGFADGLAAGAAAGMQKAPLILVDGSASQLPAKTNTLLRDLGVTKATIAGGKGAVSAGIENALKTTVGGSGTVVRGSGTDRFSTASWFAERYSTPGGAAYIANGWNFPDALSGAVAAGAAGAPLLLSQPACLPPSSLDVLLGVGPTQVYLLGGTGALSARVANYTRC